MGKIEFVEDILAPREYIDINYTGKNPFLIFGIILPLLRDILKVSAANLREDKIRWVSLGDVKGFYGAWRGYRPEDRWTRTLIKVFADGNHDREKYGSVHIWIKGYLETRFEYSNPVSKALWLLFNYLFYWKQRRAYIDFSRDNILKLKEEILSAYNILVEERKYV